MPEPSKRERILEVLIGRLERIQVSNGFSTDVGQTLYLGEAPMLGPDDRMTPWRSSSGASRRRGSKASA